MRESTRAEVTPKGGSLQAAILLAITLSCCTGDAPPATPRAVPSELETKVQRLLESGAVTRLDVDRQTAFVEPAPWNATSLEVKTGVGAVLADYFHARNGRDRWAIIRNSHDGKQLARYGPFGLSVD